MVLSLSLSLSFSLSLSILNLNSIEVLLFQPWPKPRLVIHATEHVAEAFFFNRLVHVILVEVWSWGVLEELGHAIGPHGRWDDGPRGGMGQKWAVNCWCSGDVQIGIRAVLTPVAAATLCLFVEVDGLGWLSIFECQYLLYNIHWNWNETNKKIYQITIQHHTYTWINLNGFRRFGDHKYIIHSKNGFRKYHYLKTSTNLISPFPPKFSNLPTALKCFFFY